MWLSVARRSIVAALLPLAASTACGRPAAVASPTPCAPTAAVPNTTPRARTAAAAPSEPFTAVVREREARLTFPLPDQAEWAWQQATTPDDQLEYGWTAEVENRGRRYEFGFLLFKNPRLGPGRGDLAALLAAGQHSVAVRDGGSATVASEERVRVEPGPSRLVVVVDDPRTLQLLFSGRPASATFVVQLPGQPVVTREVPVRYAP